VLRLALTCARTHRILRCYASAGLSACQVSGSENLTRPSLTSTESSTQARNGQLATGQVYVADTGYWLVRAGVPKHAIVTALGGRPTPDLATFASVLATLRPGTKAPIQYATFEQRQRTCSGLVHIDWTW